MTEAERLDTQIARGENLQDKRRAHVAQILEFIAAEELELENLRARRAQLDQEPEPAPESTRPTLSVVS